MHYTKRKYNKLKFTQRVAIFGAVHFDVEEHCNKKPKHRHDQRRQNSLDISD